METGDEEGYQQKEATSAKRKWAKLQAGHSGRAANKNPPVHGHLTPWTS
jgi:hypothetical protein